MSEFWSKGLDKLEPYVPGEQPKVPNLNKLNTNESPHAPGPAVSKALAEFDVEKLRLYPDPQSIELRKAIAEYHGLDIENVFVGNGSDEVLAHAFRAFFQRGLPLLAPDITYSFYPVYCKLFDIEYETIPLTEDFSIDLAQYGQANSGIIFPNPNAPTARLLALSEIESLLESNRRSVVLIDEAYIDFAPENSSAASLVERYPNLLVARTLSKSRALAGLRLGYALGPKELIEGLTRVKDSFNSYPIDQLASALAVASFQDEEYFKKIVADVVSERERLIDNLLDLGFECIPSAANFVFAKPAGITAEELAGKLREQGVIVRFFGKPRLEEYLRITVGSQVQNQRLVSVLREIV